MDWVVTIVGLTGFFLAGRKIWWAWYVNLGCQALWVAYAIVSQQYAFIIAAMAYSIIFVKNAIAWTKEHRAKKYLREWEPTALYPVLPEIELPLLPNARYYPSQRFYRKPKMALRRSKILATSGRR
jgi:hypothetical protein